MSDSVIVTSGAFKELVRFYDVKAGVYPEFASVSHAHRSFVQTMRARGYSHVGARTWSKPGMAVILEPRR